jgi:ribosomal protein S18 acetylase RimI-like enzyme
MRLPLPGQRPLGQSDGRLLGELMHAAYAGTVDDDGEGLEGSLLEAERTLAGVYGPLIGAASWLIIDGGKAIAASVITLWDPQVPLIAFALTHPDHRRRGLAAHLMQTSMANLQSMGYSHVRLAVTLTNHPAVQLYRKLGFEEEPIPVKG